MRRVPLAPGIRVFMLDGTRGTIACDLDHAMGTTDHPIEDWSYLGSGVLVLTDEAGLVHYPDGNSVTREVA